MVDGALYGIGFGISKQPPFALRAALRNFHGRTHPRRQDRSDQFAVGHFQSPKLHLRLASLDCRARFHPPLINHLMLGDYEARPVRQRNRRAHAAAETTGREGPLAATCPAVKSNPLDYDTWAQSATGAGLTGFGGIAPKNSWK